MFERLLKLVRDITDADQAAKAFDDTDHRLAAAALLVHAVAIDGIVEDAEKTKIRELLQTEFGLDEKKARALIAQAREKDNEAVDLYTFTSVLARALDQDGRKRIVEMLWQIIYADGQVHEFEDNLVWRVAELLGVSRRDRIILKKRVAGTQGDG